jgi:hypothetical protein
MRAPEILKIDFKSSTNVLSLKIFFKLLTGLSLLISGFIDSSEKRGPIIKKLTIMPIRATRAIRGTDVENMTCIAEVIRLPIRFSKSPAAGTLLNRAIV